MINTNCMSITPYNVIENKSDNFFKTCLFIGPLFLLLILDFLDLNSRGILGYLDEIIALYYLGYIVFNLIVDKNSKLLKWFALLLLFVAIGLLGNVFNNIYTLNLYWIFLDTFFFIKPFIYLIAAIVFFKHNKTKHLIKLFSNLSKFLLILVFMGSMIHIIKCQFNFNYIWNVDRYRFTTSHCVTLAKYLTLFILSILISNSRHKKFYFTIGFISTLISTSGAGILSYFLIFVFVFLFKKYHFKWYHLTLVGVLAILLGWNEISGYLLDDTQARSITYIYSFVTANRYFPLGSGFGTYGGYSAAYNYSILYQQYGFNNVWGLSQYNLVDGNCFLFDTYYPMIIGQFGYIGFALFLFVLIHIFVKLFKSKKYITVSFMLSIMVIAFGFNITNPATCFIFVIGGLIYVTESKYLSNGGFKR